MTATILLTGFGPFPGAPRNPTGALVRELALRHSPALGRARRVVHVVAHVFPTSYEAVDRELPALLARDAPDLLLMFGLASRRPHISIETRARNALTRRVPDVGGQLATADVIAADAPAAIPMLVPAGRLAAAVRAEGLPAVLSSNAGDYLCNYLCWRACEAAEADNRLRMAAFVHVPMVHGPNGIDMTGLRSGRRSPRARMRPSFADLVVAGEALMRAALTAAPRVACI